MKNLGIVRHLDDLGRITLPKELRRTFEIKDGDPVEIFTDNNTICLKPVPKAVCMACGGVDYLVEKGGKHICSSCLEGFAEGAGIL